MLLSAWHIMSTQNRAAVISVCFSRHLGSSAMAGPMLGNGSCLPQIPSQLGRLRRAMTEESTGWGAAVEAQWKRSGPT